MSTNVVNPYSTALIDALSRIRTVSPFNTTLLNSLTAFSVIFAVALLFALASLALRWWNGTLWFFELVPTCKGNLIVAHESNVHTLFSIAFLASMQHYLIVAKNTATIGGTMQNSVLSRTYPWYILYLSSWSIIWESFTTTYLETKGAEKKSRITPKLINIFFIAFPLLFALLPCFTLAVVANMQYNIFFQNVALLVKNLTDAASRFEQKLPIDDLGLINLYALALRQADRAGFTYRISWIISLVPIIISLTIFITSSIAYARFLSNSMERLRAQRRAGSTFLSHYRAVSLAQRSNYATLGVVSIVYGLWFGLAAWLAIDIQRITTDPKDGQLVLLIPLWFYAPLGFFSHVTIFIRSMDWRYVNPSASATTTTTASSAGKRASTLPPTTNKGSGSSSEEFIGSAGTTGSFEMNHYYSTHLELNKKGKEAPFAADEGDKVDFSVDRESV